MNRPATNARNTDTPEPPAFTGERAGAKHANLYAFKRIYDLVSTEFGGVEKVVLDYGCGTGYGTFILSQHFASVTGVDVDAETVGHCQKEYADAANLRFEVLDPSSQPFPDASFDHIFSFQVFEHVPLDQIEDYAMYVWRMLKPGGTAIITTPNSRNYHGGHSGNPFHIKEYSHEEMVAFFERVLPPQQVSVSAVQDVLSTRVYTTLLRGSRNRIPKSVVGQLIRPFRLLEKRGILPTSFKNMRKTTRPERVIGSHYVEIRKPG